MATLIRIFCLLDREVEWPGYQVLECSGEDESCYDIHAALVNGGVANARYLEFSSTWNI
jgi:hypothetical protein